MNRIKPPPLPNADGSLDFRNPSEKGVDQYYDALTSLIVDRLFDDDPREAGGTCVLLIRALGRMLANSNRENPAALDEALAVTAKAIQDSAVQHWALLCGHLPDTETTERWFGFRPPPPGEIVDFPGPSSPDNRGRK